MKVWNVLRRRQTASFHSFPKWMDCEGRELCKNGWPRSFMFQTSSFHSWAVERRRRRTGWQQLRTGSLCLTPSLAICFPWGPTQQQTGKQNPPLRCWGTSQTLGKIPTAMLPWHFIWITPARSGQFWHCENSTLWLSNPNLHCLVRSVHGPVSVLVYPHA